MSWPSTSVRLTRWSPTQENLRESLFGERSVAEGRIAYVGDEPAGMALFFHNFSTWPGLPGLYLEDLYVRPEMRGRGVGRALLATSPASPASATAPASSGPCSTGTSRPSVSTEPRRRPDGRVDNYRLTGDALTGWPKKGLETISRGRRVVARTESRKVGAFTIPLIPKETQMKRITTVAPPPSSP